MRASPEIVVLGTIKLDVRIPVQGPLGGEEEIAAGDAAFFVGGKGANQALAVSQHGGRATLIGCIGDDAIGRLVLQGLHGAGVSTALVRVVTGADTAVSVVLVTANGRNRIVTTRGASAHLTVDDVARDPVVGRAAAILSHGEVALAVTDAAFRIAPPAALRLYTWGPVLSRRQPPFRALTDLLVVNQTEAALVTDEREPVAAARCLLATGWPRVLITLGARGALLVDPDGTVTVPAPAVTPVDTTGAGDTLIGVLAVRWSLPGCQGLVDALPQAVTAASQSTTRLSWRARIR